MAQNRLPPVPRVDNPDEYLIDIFGTSKDPNIPSFYEFMEKMRGVPISTFSKESLETLALIMETTFYSQYVGLLQEQTKAAAGSKTEAQATASWADNVSTDEINGAITAMQERIDQLKAVREQKVEQNA